MVIEWYLFVGTLLVVVAIFVPTLQRRWLSPTHLLFLAGIVAGPMCLGLLTLKLKDHGEILQIVSEIAVLISLYAAGIKLRMPLSSHRWVAPVLLASATMVVTVALATATGAWLFGMSLGGSILLGAVLAPTDPVLADKVQVEDPNDSDRLRQSLTGEAGLNDGTAFPFVLLAVGLCDPNLHQLGEGLWQWIAIDLIWRIVAGLVLGAVAGTLLGKWSWYRAPHQNHEGVDELLAIGFIAIIYGVALAINCYGFLAVFAAAVCLRRTEVLPSEEQTHDDRRSDDAPKIAKQDTSAFGVSSAENQATLLREQTAVASAFERIAQAFLVVSVGIIITSEPFYDWRTWVFGLLMIFLIRPISVLLTLRVRSIDDYQRNLIAWFGIRGIGTIYYLTHAITLGIEKPLGAEITPIIGCCIATITLSIWLHGLSDTPLMKMYSTYRARKRLAKHSLQ